MATLAHCTFCFESLAASLEKRQPLSLRQVEELWDKYEAESTEDDEADDEDMEDAEEPQTNLKHAAISRLVSSNPSSSTSSVPSTSSSRTSLSQSSTAAHPLFVTWNTVNSRGHTSLRGCIGTFEAQELSDGLRSYALTSAFDDSRFMPITQRELPSLEVGVTLLTNFEPAADPMAWELGKHGLRISFNYKGRRYGATYLPDVAKEQGWTKEETMVSLMRKAGWSGRADDWRKVGDLNVITYQGAKVAMLYSEWREWRDWVDEKGA
ncbi:hypothetical protein K490DRAFT_48937 [Saccharata proteae CBS 121410]|uniref:AMMECR1 domain-containing protein n=1 Tax=Saccharata proteae CBS 121410 TaxID=1314787 RepID=A0A9P4HSN8_9PEZI|nr:hypothetical protein K490DRAFT_48937 [Saccharata proteae CBS 121410]